MDELLTVDASSNRALAMNTHSYTYDGRGNRATQAYGSSTASYVSSPVKQTHQN